MEVSALKAGSVLVVEDDFELLQLLVRGLREEGLRATVIDVGLPDADGRDVSQAIRARGITAPVLFLTARDAVSDPVQHGITLHDNTLDVYVRRIRRKLQDAGSASRCLAGRAQPSVTSRRTNTM
jgi:DNA-binding response OmpR family regulator